MERVVDVFLPFIAHTSKAQEKEKILGLLEVLKDRCHALVSSDCKLLAGGCALCPVACPAAGHALLRA